jgi:arylsulfatase A-like enzyme
MFDGFDRVVRARPLHPLHLTPGETLRALWLPQIGTRAMKPTPPADFINRGVLNAVRRCGDGPCFVFANYMDAHAPYAPPAPWAGRWAGHWAPVVTDADASGEELRRAAARHDEAIGSLDAALGALLTELAGSGVLDRWWLIVTADHGEAFGEHGVVAHGKGLHVEQTKIPLLIQPPRGVRLEAWQDPVSLIDVATTIAALGGISRFGAGNDLRRRAAPGALARLEFAGRGYTDTGRGGRAIAPSRAVVVGRRQLIESAGRRELYDLGEDPRQRRDLATAAPGEVEGLAALLPPGFPPWPAAPGLEGTPGGETEEATRRDLRTLGYLD